MQAEIGDSVRIAQWIENIPALKGADYGLMQWMIKFSLIRLLKASQRFEEALTLAVDLETAAAAAKSVARQIEALMLQAETHWQVGRKELAFSCLSQSLNLAEPRGYVRLFLDEGPALQPALTAMQLWPGLPLGIKLFTARLLADFPVPVNASTQQANSSIQKSGSTQGLNESLSDRELEVLRLLAQGLTLAEIAKQLYLSTNTLKAHTQNIYSKLDVHSRVDLVNKAREFGFIS